MPKKLNPLGAGSVEDCSVIDNPCVPESDGSVTDVWTGVSGVAPIPEGSVVSVPPPETIPLADPPKTVNVVVAAPLQLPEAS